MDWDLSQYYSRQCNESEITGNMPNPKKQNEDISQQDVTPIYMRQIYMAPTRRHRYFIGIILITSGDDDVESFKVSTGRKVFFR